MLSDGGNEKGEKKNNGLISKKATFARAANFFCTFLCRCFARIQRETSRNFLVTLFLEEMSYVFSFTFFHCPLIFTLHWWPLALLMLSPPLQNFHVVLPKKNVSFFFSSLISRSRSLSPFLSLSFAGLPPTFSFSLSFSCSVFQICGHDN